ncbi:MAG: hypothetical protein GY788_13835 [bacterium]|nr:hypothetical protein [bacterium]
MAVATLMTIQSNASLLLDADREVIAEYRTNVGFGGQRGVGDEFFQWAFDNHAQLTVLELHQDPHRGYEEFPDSSGLEGFDSNDRKWVALALAHGDAVVVNALDSDYAESKLELEDASVEVVELCPHQIHVKG